LKEYLLFVSILLLLLLLLLNFEIFRLSGLNFRPIISRIEEYDKDSKIIFYILYKHYLPKNSELKNQVLKLRFEI